MINPNLWLVTGPRGAGKTTFCGIFSEQARLAGWDVAGLLSPAVFNGGVKVGILAENLRTREFHPLASAASHPSFDFQLGDWYFDRTTIEWGNRILETSLPCDLFLVDELGPLEFLRGAGWASALSVLHQPDYHLGIIVVRPELLEIAQASFVVTGTISLDRSNDPAANALHWWNEFSGDSHD
jgi:nucleoside-triphosphatase